MIDSSRYASRNLMNHTRRYIAILTTLISLTALALLNAHAEEQEELVEVGLPSVTGGEEVVIYCAPCHSLKLVAQQGLSREAWEETIQSMYDEQEMEPMEPTDYELVLNYLSEYVSIEANLAKREQN